jgi:hypothetical protein
MEIHSTKPSRKEIHGLCVIIPIGCQIGELMVLHGSSVGATDTMRICYQSSHEDPIVIVRLFPVRTPG